MPRFPTLDALREHLRNPTPVMFAIRESEDSRRGWLKELADGPSLALSSGGRLAVYSQERGRWQVLAPGVARYIHTVRYNCTTKAKALVVADLMEQGFEIPWDADDAHTLAQAYRNEFGERFERAFTRLVAGHPVLDKDGMLAHEVAAWDADRIEHQRILARDVADGYTETVRVSEIRVGDEVSYRYFGKSTYRWKRLGLTDDWVTLTIRATVQNEGRHMTRHGNNYDEGMDGVRYKATGISWIDDCAPDSTLTGTLPDGDAPTMDWITRVRRKPDAVMRAKRADASWIKLANWSDGGGFTPPYRKVSTLGRAGDFHAKVEEEHAADGRTWTWRVFRQRTTAEGPDEHGSWWTNDLETGTEPTRAKAKSAATRAMKRLRAEHLAAGGDVGC
jgi:hypothetical protein